MGDWRELLAILGAAAALLLALAAFLAAGCAGCLVGPDGTFVDPGDYQPPEWEQVSP